MEIIKILMSILILLAGLFGFDLDSGEEEGLLVGSFNAQVFGDSKIEKVGAEYYVDLVRDYDLFFLLEIRDKDGSSFDSVCEALVEYNYSCLVSERAGRSSSKEQVGVIYRDGLNVSLVEVLDEGDFFEREPVVVVANGTTFYVLHLKPSDVSNELSSLEKVLGVRSQGLGGVVLIGDLNADCLYYDNDKESHFDSWDWWTGDGVDTTSGATDCAYDRVVSRDVEVLGSGAVEIDEDVSDHNLIWVELKS